MRLNKENGFALIGAMIGAILILMVMGMAVLFNSKTSVQQATTLAFSNKAFYFADSGIAAAVAQLRNDPTDLNAINFSVAIGTYSVLLTQLGPGYVKAVSRGLCQDSAKTIQARIVVQSPGEYFGASGKTLTVAYGTNAPTARVYGKTVNFLVGPLGDAHTKLKEACYFTGQSGFDSNYIEIARDTNDDGVIEAGLSPTQSPTEPVLPILDSAKMDNYKIVLADKTTAQGGGIIMDPDGDGIASLGDGVNPITAPANNNGVYYFEGVRLDIKGPINGKFIVVMAGNINITGNILYPLDPITGLPTGNDLLALVSTRDVTIDVGNYAGAVPNNWVINGLIIAPYGNLLATGNPNPLNNFVFNGGFLVNNKVELATVFAGSRSYNYVEAHKTIPYLPFLVYVDKWEEIR